MIYTRGTIDLGYGRFRRASNVTPGVHDAFALPVTLRGPRFTVLISGHKSAGRRPAAQSLPAPSLDGTPPPSPYVGFVVGIRNSSLSVRLVSVVGGRGVVRRS